jgi:coenzyme F420 biosynthesis associated uncharacterized protein
MVDWELAVGLGSRVAGDGPQVSAGEAAAVVAELREGAARSTPLVREVTGLEGGAEDTPVLVVDRPGWVRANTEGFAKIIEPLAERLARAKGDPSALAVALGSRVTGAEVGLLLGFMSTKVLGQFDPFHEPAGRLLLVAPNVVHVERELDVDPHDFRLWVCLHEETHRVQFTAVPWMREHLFSEIAALTETVEPQRMGEDLVRRLSEALRGSGGSLLETLSTPEQKEILDRVTGMMSLLEGHADVVMDSVGPTVIGTVADIRKKFDQRRKGVGPLDRILRKVLGLDAKMAQYRDGAAFVRAVVDRVGMAEFNAVWAGPQNLPTRSEVTDPDAWVARVLS